MRQPNPMLGIGAEALRPGYAIATRPRTGRVLPPGWSSLPVFALILLAVLGPFLSLGSTSHTGEGNATRQLCYQAVFLFALWEARAWRHPLRTLLLPLSLLAPLAWCFASTAWSLDPSITIRRLLLTCLVLWTAFISVRRVGFDGAASAVRFATTLILVASYVAVFLFPSVGIHQVGEITDPGLVGNWRGVLQQKNYTGAVLAMTILYFLFTGRDMRWVYRVAMIAAAGFFLVMTRSKTSIALLIVAVAFGGLMRLYNPRYRALALCGVGIVVTAAVWAIHANWATIVAPFSHPEALTGRGQIWLVLIRYAADHLALGAGYGAFWNIGPSSPVYEYGRGWVQDITSGHNGYLDLLVTIGAPGVILVLAGVLIWPLGKLFWSPSLTRDQRGLLAASLLFCMGHNFTEASLLERDQIVEIFLVLTLAMIHAPTPRRRVTQGAWRPLEAEERLPAPAGAGQ